MSKGINQNTSGRNIQKLRLETVADSWSSISFWNGSNMRREELMCTQDIQAVTKAQHKHRNPPQTRSSALFFLMREMTIYRNCLRESWIFRVVTFCKLTELYFSLARDLFIRTWKKYHFSTQRVVWSAANSKTTYHFHLINISFHFFFYEILPTTHAAPVQINNERNLKFEWNHNVKEDRLLCNYFMDKKY